MDQETLQKEVEKSCREIGGVIAKALPKGIGFTLMVFDFGEGGHMTYTSNAERADMIKAMKEFIAKNGG